MSDGWISFGTLHERQRDRFEAQLGKDDVARIDYLRYAVPTAGFRQRDQAANWGRIVLNLAIGLTSIIIKISYPKSSKKV